MACPIIDFERQVWYTGYSNDVMENTITFRGVGLSYNLDTLGTTVHPHEQDVVLAPVKGFDIPSFAPEVEYVFMEPVLYEEIFFNRENNISKLACASFRRARFIQMFDYKNTFAYYIKKRSEGINVQY